MVGMNNAYVLLSMDKPGDRTNAHSRVFVGYVAVLLRRVVFGHRSMVDVRSRRVLGLISSTRYQGFRRRGRVLMSVRRVDIVAK